MLFGARGRKKRLALIGYLTKKTVQDERIQRKQSQHGLEVICSKSQSVQFLDTLNK